jgi:hypothetical protein
MPYKHTPALSTPLIKDLSGDTIDGTFNCSSVIGMSRYLHNHMRPDVSYTVVSVIDLLKIQ